MYGYVSVKPMVLYNSDYKKGKNAFLNCFGPLLLAVVVATAADRCERVISAAVAIVIVAVIEVNEAMACVTIVAILRGVLKNFACFHNFRHFGK